MNKYLIQYIAGGLLVLLVVIFFIFVLRPGRERISPADEVNNVQSKQEETGYPNPQPAETADAPYFKVISPNGGERFCIGDEMRIDWEGSPFIKTVTLNLGVPNNIYKHI